MRSMVTAIAANLCADRERVRRPRRVPPDPAPAA